MRKVLYFALSAIFLAAGSAAFGADFGENKPYDTWSQKECNKLLEGSPWVEDLTLIGGTLSLVNKKGQPRMHEMQFRSIRGCPFYFCGRAKKTPLKFRGVFLSGRRRTFR